MSEGFVVMVLLIAAALPLLLLVGRVDAIRDGHERPGLRVAVLGLLSVVGLGLLLWWILLPILGTAG